MQFRIFLSSVQSEFADERARLKAYIEKTPLLRRFFSAFVFESDVPPQDRRTDEVYADRLEIYNPGSINPALTPEKLKERHGSFPNNPLMAEPLYLTRYIERLGTGLTDLSDHCRAAGLSDPEFHIDRFEFGIVIRRKGVGGVKDVDAVNDAVNDTVNSLYEYIKGHPGINGRKLAVALSCSEPTIDRQVRVLKVKGLVEFHGAPKNGGYYVR